MEKTAVVSALKVEFIAPTEFVEHPQHQAFFLAPARKNKTESYHDSLFKFGKVKPVIYISKDGKKLVIDGWSYVVYALSNSFTEVAACCLDLTDEEDIAQIMLELQFSDHSSAEEEYKDLDELEKESTGDKKRNPTTYDRIAAMTNASSGKRVQYILKIGAVNPKYLTRMDVEKMSAFRAYENCIREEKGILPKPRQKKEPVVVSTPEPDVLPEFPAPFKSKEEIRHSFDLMVAQVAKQNKLPILTKHDLNVAEDEVCYTVIAICTSCGSPVKVEIPKMVLQTA